MESRRQRYRMQTRGEAKAIALRQLAVAGPEGISLNAIAREMGVTGPALYRYFASRDELLTELVLDAYRDLATAVQTVPAGVPAAHLRRLAEAYRSWALAQPHRYRLLYGPPVPGYPAHTTEIVAAAQRTFKVFVDAIAACPARPRRGRLVAELAAWAQRHRFEGLSGAAALLGVKWWSRLHGAVLLEIQGNFASMAIDGELFFRDEVAELLGSGPSARPSMSVRNSSANAVPIVRRARRSAMAPPLL